MPNPSAAGLYTVRNKDSLAGLVELHRRVADEIINSVGAIRGSDAKNRLIENGLESLHLEIDAAEVGQVRNRVLEALRESLLVLGASVGRAILSWTDDFFIDDYLILRINFPYEVARRSPSSAENPGIGRVSPSVRELAAARRVKDPLYDPAAYHRGHPPAAWAHGPHVDSWTGHSRDGINIWWAISDVPAEAGMALYPDVDPRDLEADPRTLYLAAGRPLPLPTFTPLRAGEMLVFDPEILHGTRLNLTEQTRVAVSLRVNAHLPAFDPGSFYAREFWRRASEVESGRFETVQHIKREENLAEAQVKTCRPPPEQRLVRVVGAPGAWVNVASSASIREQDRVIVETPDRRVIVLRVSGQLRAMDSVCPHYGLDLVDGANDASKIHCPGCAISFNFETGRSSSPSLQVHVHEVAEKGGQIMLRLAAT